MKNINVLIHSIVARVYQDGARKNLIEYLKSVAADKVTPEVEIKINQLIDALEKDICNHMPRNRC